MTPELIVLILNSIILLLAYYVIYPRFVRNNLNKLLINDVMVSLVAIVIAGSIYYGSDMTFSLIITTTNWFWFSLLSYTIIEIPLMLRYLKKHNISIS